MLCRRPHETPALRRPVFLRVRRRTTRVLSPLGTTPDTVKPLAKRRSRLDGLRIGLLDNSKPNADVLLGRVAELLAARAPGFTIRSWTKPGSSRPATMIDEIASSVDVVLTGSAD